MTVSLLFSALTFVAQLVVQSAIIKGSLELTRGGRLEVGSAFSGIDWGQVIIAALIIGAATFVGLVLCILPGLVVIFLTSYTLYFVVDHKLPAVDAIRASVSLVTRQPRTAAPLLPGQRARLHRGHLRLRGRPARRDPGRGDRSGVHVPHAERRPGPPADHQRSPRAHDAPRTPRPRGVALSGEPVRKDQARVHRRAT